MKSIRSIYESGNKDLLKNSPKAYPGHELYKKNPSLHGNGASANGVNLKQIVEAINGSSDIKKILPTNIPGVPTFKDPKYASQYDVVNPLSNGTFSNLDAQSEYASYQKFLNNLGNKK